MIRSVLFSFGFAIHQRQNQVLSMAHGQNALALASCSTSPQRIVPSRENTGGVAIRTRYKATHANQRVRGILGFGKGVCIETLVIALENREK
ncbi:hypothetical protein [Rhizobium sp. AN80A]|uniref:hypothetical protein n=1 Tax=Rhizobium sp. AN80A TaxID=3040673 RepID=UPI0024B3A34F|nr:hypothetical protein [Rhizobium sp. AN80A]